MVLLIIVLIIANIYLATKIKDMLDIKWLNRLALFPPFGIIAMLIISIVMLTWVMIDAVKDNWG
jgi:hypothetical protein